MSARANTIATDENHLVIGFRSSIPFLMWSLKLVEPVPEAPETYPPITWNYWVTADTGDILAFGKSGIAVTNIPIFIRGDSNTDKTVDLSDAIGTLENLFLGKGLLLCPDAADSNDDGSLDQSDAIHTLTYFFLGGVAIPHPGPLACGYDRTADTLDCASDHPGCK